MTRTERKRVQSPKKSPLEVRERQGVWWVYFDTPGSAVNIVTQSAAEGILEVMKRAERQEPRAVVFISGKETSYINGAQLMMASAVQSAADVYPLTELLRAAYGSVRASKVPTIAAIRGTCYGCGVEFTLNCDHRVVSDRGPTQFYMTELADYLDTPAFGSTQRLPKLMPLPEAVNFLMWGKRFRAEEAVFCGLASQVIEGEDFEKGVFDFIEALLAEDFTPPAVTHLSKGERRDYEASIWEAIAQLPPEYRRVHQACFELMVHGANKETVEPADIKLELDACGESLVQPVAHRARSLLFVRQLAERVCLRRPPEPKPLLFVIPSTEPELADFREEIVESRYWRGQVVDELDVAADPTAISYEFRPLTEREQGSSAGDLVVRYSTGINSDEPVEGPGLIYKRPVPGLKRWNDGLERPQGGATMLVELAGHRAPGEAEKQLFDYLTEFDAAVIFSRPDDAFACDVMSMAYLAPMVSWVTAGHSPEAIFGAMHDFGFMRMPFELLESVKLSSGLHRGLVARCAEGHKEQALIEAMEVLGSSTQKSTEGSTEQDWPLLMDAILLSLLHGVNELVSGKVVPKAAVADVIARELLDFPIARGTLCQWVTPDRVAEALARGSRLEQLISNDVRRLATSFVEEGRAFYV